MSKDAGDVLARMLLAIFGVFVLLISFVVLLIMNAAREARQKKRRVDLAAQAKRLGLTFADNRNAGIVKEYSFLDRMYNARGGSEYMCLNYMTGEHESHPVRVFDYYYVTDANSVWWWAPSWKSHRYLSFMIVNMDTNFPELTIAKEGFFAKIAQAVGFDDIDFESHEFSKRYLVKSRDKKFAYDFCNAKMIDYLLDRRTMTIEVERHALALGFDDQFRPNDVNEHLTQVVKIRTLMPNYLFTPSKE